MKSILAFFLAMIMFLIGLGSLIYSVDSKEMNIVTFIGSLCLTVPCLFYWEDLFNNIINKK